ncbi:hypothetical protein CFI00_08900 [Nocardioides sp. S5]|jgi:hypothetical protein|nr:hypothetical protein CFI00_08900 [Nocardioides sp. S5]
MAADDDKRPSGRTVHDDDVPPKMPSWVKYLLLGLLAAVVVAVLTMLVVGGEHGPGRHGASHSAPAGIAGLQAWQ